MQQEDHSSNSSRQPRRFVQKFRRAILLYVLVPYVAVTVIFALFQRQLLYQPTVADDLSLESLGLVEDFGRDVELLTEDGKTLRGWLVYASDQDNTTRAPLVLYFPGNSINRHERLADLKEVAACGYDVLIFDYRGFGDSQGSPSEAHLSLDARSIWNYAVTELGYEEQRIVVFGESIGGAVALSLWDDPSAAPQPAALILNSTFAALPETVGWHYPWFPFRYVLLDRWPSIERIPNVTGPVTIYHGTDDQIVPISQGKRLAAASPHAEFIEISGGGHNEIPIFQLRETLMSMAELSAVGRESTGE